MGLIIIGLIIVSIICFWRGKVILTDFPSPRFAFCYKQLGILLFSISFISIIIVIVIIIELLGG